MEHSGFRPGDYLTFRLAGRHFAMDAACVRGILPATELLPPGEASPFDPPLLIGFASLGGRMIPVIDLSRKLDLPAGARGRQPCIVVVEAGTAVGPRMTGFVVDRVAEVVRPRARDFRLGKLRIGRPREILDPSLAVAIETSRVNP